MTAARLPQRAWYVGNHGSKAGFFMQIEREMRWKRGQYRCRGFFPHGSCIKLEHHDWKEERSQVVSLANNGPPRATFIHLLGGVLQWKGEFHAKSLCDNTENV